jgi:hypothetical protein
MPKKISSPSSRWPGAVTFSEPLNMPQALAWQRARQEVDKLRVTEPIIVDGKETYPIRDDVIMEEINVAQIPGIIACVDSWELEGFPQVVTPNNFPSSPRLKNIELIAWLVNTIWEIYWGTAEVEDPNG